MIVKPGATDVTTYFHLRLTADGTAATGLTITGLDLTYVRSGSAPASKVDATALSTTSDAHSDNKAIEVDSTNMPGVYRVDWPDAAFASGAREVVLYVKESTVFGESMRVELDGAADQVNNEVNDVVNVDTQSLPGQTALSNTPTLVSAVMALYKFLRNKKDQTATLGQVYDDAGTTVDQKWSRSDDETTATIGEVESGP